MTSESNAALTARVDALPALRQLVESMDMRARK